MEIIKPVDFLKFFPDHTFRFIDLTGEGRKAVSTATYDRELNRSGYETYFTVNGFANFESDQDNRLEHLTSLHAFFIDIDGRKSLEELDEIRKKLEPTYIVETMRGYHIYWTLDEYLYKNEMTPEKWETVLSEWEETEQAIVTSLNGDPAVKDATRILRVPGTYYWKKSGDAWKDGVEKSPFKIKIIFSNVANGYSMKTVQEAFPPKKAAIMTGLEITHRKTQAEREDFFRRLDAKYPITDRPSYQKLKSGEDGTLPNDNPSRNTALLVVASLARSGGEKMEDLFEEIRISGWHGMVKERGGLQEIRTTIESAYRGEYTFGRNNPYIDHNSTDEERKKLNDAYAAVLKDRKDLDKLRYSNYEKELISRYPHLKRNDAGMVFDYDGGVYRQVSDDEMAGRVLRAMDEDNLWTYRTGRGVSDKVMCLLSIMPKLVETPDNGLIVNVRNGLLDMKTRKLTAHDPEFVSLVQMPIDYNPDAQCPNWNASVTDWTKGDEAEGKLKILQQFAGYCLSSSTRYAKALFVIGDGGNGKSTYADTLVMLFDNSAISKIKMEGLHTQFGISGLIGKRINIVEEISGNYFHSDVIKSLISGEEVTCDVKHRSQVTFKPQAKFIFVCNAMPRVDDASSGMERRILAVNFTNHYRDNPNVDLRERDGILAKELPGIFNWVLDGADLLRSEGSFQETNEKKRMVQEYREENSSVDGFIAECLTDSLDSVISISDLYEVYRSFCQKDGRTPKAKIGFTKEMKMYANKTRRFTVHPRKHGKDDAKVEGIELATAWERNFESTFTSSPYSRKSSNGNW